MSVKAGPGIVGYTTLRNTARIEVIFGDDAWHGDRTIWKRGFHAELKDRKVMPGSIRF